MIRAGDLVRLAGQSAYGRVLDGPFNDGTGTAWSVSMWDGRALRVHEIYLISVDSAHQTGVTK